MIYEIPTLTSSRAVAADEPLPGPALRRQSPISRSRKS
jgi:hypothetical protein